MLNLSRCNFVNTGIHRLYHPRKIKEGIGGFKMTPVQFRRSMISWRLTAQAVKFVWKFATSKSVGDMIRFQSRQTIRGSVHTVRPAAVTVVDHLKKYSLANCAQHFRTAVKSIAAIVYTILLNMVLILAEFIYEHGKKFYQNFIDFVYHNYLYFLTLLNKYLGSVSDLILVGYSLSYLILWLWAIYILFKMIRAFIHNVRAVFSVGRDLSEALTEEIAYEEEMRNSNFVETVQHQLKNTILVGQVQTKVLPNGSIMISPLPKDEVEKIVAAKPSVQQPVNKNAKKK